MSLRKQHSGLLKCLTFLKMGSLIITGCYLEDSCVSRGLITALSLPTAALILQQKGKHCLVTPRSLSVDCEAYLQALSVSLSGSG